MLEIDWFLVFWCFLFGVHCFFVSFSTEHVCCVLKRADQDSGCDPCVVLGAPRANPRTNVYPLKQNMGRDELCVVNVANGCVDSVIVSSDSVLASRSVRMPV